jgi:outer membrane protein OmpA-like peptidoglycan-associated protein
MSATNCLVADGGVTGTNMTTRGLGEANPVAPNENPEGSDNPKNR